MDIETLKTLVEPGLHDYLEEILEMCNAPYAVDNGIELVSVSNDRRTVLKKKIIPEDLNSNGFAHGAVTYGLMDHAFAICCNITEPTVGLSCNITYHRPCAVDAIEAETKVVNESRSLITVDVLIRGGGKLIASAVCIGFKARMK
jgi:uncharacterized domain 1